MPTLTDDQALARYRAIVAREGLEPNHILNKSSLYQRLRQGKPALAHPPPLAHSYPWYAVVESDVPLAIEEPQAWHFPDATDREEMVVIFQTLWTVLAREDGRLRLTYPRWQAMGMQWAVWQEWCTADQAGSKLLCHHDPQKGILRTEDDLSQEAAMRVHHWVTTLRVASTHGHDEALAMLSETRDGDDERSAWFRRGVAEQTLHYALKELAQRQQDGKPDVPGTDEKHERHEKEKRSLLRDEWDVRDGLLYHRSWWIQRVTPTPLPDVAYLS